MKLFSKKVHRLQASWRYDSGGVLWLFRFGGASGEGGRIVGEARDTERKTASFFCLEERTGRPLWEKLAFDEPWWVGIEDVTGDAVYFHRYQAPNLPQHRGIMRVDLESGALLWDEPAFAFVAADDTRVIVARQRFEGSDYAALDAATGMPMVGDVDAQAAQAARQLRDDPAAFAGCAYPETLDPAIPAHAEALPLLDAHVPAQRLGDVELLLRDGIAVASWHVAGGAPDTVDQHVLAADLHDGGLLFTERINTALPRPMIDSFMTKDDQLLFVTERRTLTAYSLQQASR